MDDSIEFFQDHDDATLWHMNFPVGGGMYADIPMKRREAEELMYQMVFCLGYKLEV